MGLFKIAHFWNWIQGLFSRNIYGFRFKTKNKKTPPWFTLKMTQLIFKMSPPTISVGHDRSISSYASDWSVDQPIRNPFGPSTLSRDFVHFDVNFGLSLWLVSFGQPMKNRIFPKFKFYLVFSSRIIIIIFQMKNGWNIIQLIQQVFEINRN